MDISEDSLLKLKCAECDLYLSVGPIRIHNDRFFCGRCSNTGTQIKIYEELAQSFDFPCRYQSFGCKKLINWDFVPNHEQTCNKKPHPCPMVPTGVCLWYGTIDDMKKHFENSHAEEVTESNVIELNLDENLEECRLIKNKNKYYIFHVYFNLSQKLAKLNVLRLSAKKSINEQKYQLTLFAQDRSKHITLNAHKIQIYESMDSGIFDENDIIDISILTFLLGDNPSIICEIDFDLIGKEIFKLLQCAVCKEFMLSPIYECQTGHSFCNSCSLKFKNCPLCQQKLSRLSDYLLGACVDQLFGSCKNKALGCTHKGKSEDIWIHEETCEYYRCPLGISVECGWSGDFGDMIEHCKNNHHYFENNCCHTMIFHRFVSLIYFDNLFFRICQKYQNEEFSVDIQFVGPNIQAIAYMYEFTVEARDGSERKLSLCNSCQPLTEDEASLDNCIRIPYFLLKLFENTPLKWKIRIFNKTT